MKLQIGNIEIEVPDDMHVDVSAKKVVITHKNPKTHDYEGDDPYFSRSLSPNGDY